jgi:hypothetical protein
LRYLVTILVPIVAYVACVDDESVGIGFIPEC